MSRPQQQQQQRAPMSLPAKPHVPLLTCSAMYLGKGAPADVPDTFEAIQKPLYELANRDRLNGGPPERVNTTLTVFTSGIVARSSDLEPGDKWWPIGNLVDCGDFRSTDDGCFFDARTSDKNTPTLFAMTFRRRDIPVKDTWVFLVETGPAAADLVTVIKMAYLNKAGWPRSPVDRPSPALASSGSTGQVVARGSSAYKDYGRGLPEWDGAVVRSNQLSSNQRYLKDFYEKPALSGYFYTPNASLVQKYSVTDSTKPSGYPEEQWQEPLSGGAGEFYPGVNPQLVYGEQIVSYVPQPIGYFPVEFNPGNGYRQEEEEEAPPVICEKKKKQKNIYIKKDNVQRGEKVPAASFRNANDYIDPKNSYYESRIIPQTVGPPAPVRAGDPFADEGPYEIRLPVGGGGMQMQMQEPSFQPPQPRPLLDDSNFVLRPSYGVY